MEDCQPLVKEEQPPLYNQTKEASTGGYLSAPPMPSACQPPQYNDGATPVGVSAPAAAYTQHVTYMQTPPRDYMCLSVVSFFCCWPLALMAIIKSCESQEAMRQGDMLRASTAGETAKKVAIVAIVIGCIITVIVFIANVVIGMNSTNN